MLSFNLRASNLRPIPDVQYNMAFTLSASRIVRVALDLPAREEWRKEKRERVPGSSRRRAATRLERSHQRARCHYSSRPVQPLFLDRESIPGVRRPRSFPPRACINHETPRILSRQCETSVIPGRPYLFFSSPIPPLSSYAILRALRTVMRCSPLATLFFLHHVLHHVNDHHQLGVAYIAEARDAFNKSSLG